jgi:putative hemolysin
MKKTLSILTIICLTLFIFFVGCTPPPKPIGGDKDSHGCLIAAGYSWCETKQKCLRTWEENCTTACGSCPQLMPPAPGFCTDGKIVGGRKDVCGCDLPPLCERSELHNITPSQLANPASVYCREHGGVSTIETASDGSQGGTCTLADGTKCDEWAYFRGECPK